jgi:mRNA-degrading endonuclease toxin of MazEF toxin-antitoxin module
VAFPTPEPGLVIRYAFLWREAAPRGQEEGDKDRPCAIVLTTRDDQGDTVVVVLPITHSPPRNPDLAVEVPAATKRRLGLDDDRSWIVLTDANRFIWPGPDLRPRIPGDAASVACGLLPAALFREVRDRLARAVAARLAGAVTRT